MRCQWKTRVHNYQKYRMTPNQMILIFGVCDPSFGQPDHITTAKWRQKKHHQMWEDFCTKSVSSGSVPP